MELRKSFPVSSGILGRKTAQVEPVAGVSFEVARRSTLAIIGESGSGKSTIGKLIVRLLKPSGGKIEFKGVDLTKISEREFANYRPRLQMVFQDPSSALNPRRRIRALMWDALRAKHEDRKGLEQITSITEKVGLPTDVLDRYPRALSGGQKQRVNIARVLIMEPELVVLDEPTSSLDVSVQAQMIGLLKRFQMELSLTYIFISHNLAVVKNIADYVVVLYLGKVMEQGPVAALFSSPRHPYTIALLSSIPVINIEDSKMLPEEIEVLGETPSLTNPPHGCRFHPRCPYRMTVCRTVDPEPVQFDQQIVFCHLFDKKGNDALPSG